MPSTYQVFYRRPYTPIHFFTATAIMTILVFACVLAAYMSGPRSFAVLCILSTSFGGLSGAVTGLSVLAISIDPDTCWTTKRRVGGDGDGEERAVMVKRPLIGYKALRMEIETPDGYDGVWVDGYKYEDALIRL
ncbi:hypothetical protein SI65_02444 [Aspergillus cristatus]|uniref:Uncharacterized protein n=1 Tax=Aspergillus cristatus TaxID=573508 RepID=A0A1E3BKW1_ASPCR|nr:hypothetical protein SI65_02444 [Aspergillus cristatus]